VDLWQQRYHNDTTMTVNLKIALNEAQYVEFHDETYFGVWHGSHTVNYYVIIGENEVRPADTQNIGDFESGETTLEEAKEAMKSKFKSFEEY